MLITVSHMYTLVQVSSRMIESPPALLAMASPHLKNSEQTVKRQLLRKMPHRGSNVLVFFDSHSVSLSTIHRFSFTGKDFSHSSSRPNVLLNVATHAKCKFVHVHYCDLLINDQPYENLLLLKFSHEIFLTQKFPDLW